MHSNMHMSVTASQFSEGGAGDPLLPDPEELADILREELLEAYSTPREKMVTRDQSVELKRTEFTTKKKEQEEQLLVAVKEKQKALTKLYQTVLADDTVDETGHKVRKKKHRGRKTGSFHQLYEVVRDPGSGDTYEVLVDADDVIVQVFDDGPKAKKKTIVKTPTPPTPPKDATKRLTALLTDEEKFGRERTKSRFVMRTIEPKRISDASDVTEISENDKNTQTKIRTSQRKDVRFSKEHGRFSFDVDVLGPIYHHVDPDAPLPEVRDVATQVMLFDDEEEERSRSRSVSSHGSRFSVEEELAGGDASSSSGASVKMEEIAKDEPKEIPLVRKESKRRDVGTMARPRGYKDLDLNTVMAFVAFEAETQVAGADLDREEAIQIGVPIPKENTNILWPTCQDFDIDTVVKKIEDYIKRCWTIDPKWLFVVQPLEVYHDNFRKRYVFEVIFSVPSPTTPVPPATASVFFTFEIPIYSSKNEPVSVTYVLEGTRYAHKPGKIPFQDKWLWGIITDKLRLQKAINF